MEKELTTVADKIAAAEVDLEAALRKLDSARRYDVAAHVDLALHTLRGTRMCLGIPDSDIRA
jgi:hypothetical protein